jgi:hypothetical protein
MSRSGWSTPNLLLVDFLTSLLLGRHGRFPQDAPERIAVEKIPTNHLAPPNPDAVETLMALTPAGVQWS